MNNSDMIMLPNANQKVIPHNKPHFIPPQSTQLLTSWQRFALFLKKKREQNTYFKGSPHENFKGIIKSNVSRKAKHCKRHYPQNAQELKLDFSSRPADDKGLQALCLVLAKIFPKLRQLEVSFGDNKFLIQRGVELFALAISRDLTDLKMLSWDFSNCKYSNCINQDTLKKLTSILLKGPNSLCSLTLKFNKHFNDQMLDSLSKAIRRSHINLQQLTLRFDQCLYITEKGFNILADSIAKGFPSLKYFRISFGILLEPPWDYYGDLEDFCDDIEVDNYNAYYAACEEKLKEKSERNYLEEQQRERNAMEKCLREKLKFIPNLEIRQWTEY